MADMFVSRRSAIAMITSARKSRGDDKRNALPDDPAIDGELLQLLLDVRAARVDTFSLKADLTVWIMP